MKIVIAPDSFKESMDARTFAAVIRTAFNEIMPDCEYVCVPMADGGEGTVNALMGSLNGAILTVRVSDPIGRVNGGVKTGHGAEQKSATMAAA